MDELNRIQIAADLLDEVLNRCEEKKFEDRITVIYNFLLDTVNDNSGFNRELCLAHGISNQLLRTYKKDSWFIILLDSYEYLKYLKEKNSLSSEETIVLTELDKLECTFTNLFEYFMSSTNEGKIRILITKYYEYIAKGEDYIKIVEDYNYENQTPYRNVLTDYIFDITVMDELASLFSYLDDKYQGQINRVVGVSDEEDSLTPDECDEINFEDVVSDEANYEDEDEEDSEYSQAVDELFEDHEEEVHQILENFKADLHSRVMDILEKYYDDKFECDDFIGFLMSFVYTSLLKYKGTHLKEEQSILELLANPDVDYPLIVESFYSSREYVLSSLDVFTKYYYRYCCDILTHRDDLGNFEISRVSLMDKNFPKLRVSFQGKLISNPFNHIYDKFFMSVKKINNDNYIVEILNMLLEGENIDEIFKLVGINSDFAYHRLQMIRYFTRIFIENMYNSSLNDIESEPFDVLMKIMYDDISVENIVRQFKNHGEIILRGYECGINKSIASRKDSIRHLQYSDVLHNLVTVDPMLIGDAIYYRAFNDSKLFQYIEVNGIEWTISYLKSLEIDEAQEFMKEVIVTIYCHTSELTKMDSIDQTISVLCENDDNDLLPYISFALGNNHLLSQLLLKYYDYEVKEDFPPSYEERVVKNPKIKQKLYPNIDNKE